MADFTWQQGEDVTLKFWYKTKVNGVLTPQNLIGYKLRMDITGQAGNLVYVVINYATDDSSLTTLGAASNEVILGVDGLISIIIPHTASLTNGPLANKIGELLGYDMMLRDTEGRQKKILQGTVVLEASQTKWV